MAHKINYAQLGNFGPGELRNPYGKTSAGGTSGMGNYFTIWNFLWGNIGPGEHGARSVQNFVHNFTTFITILPYVLLLSEIQKKQPRYFLCEVNYKRITIREMFLLLHVLFKVRKRDTFKIITCKGGHSNRSRAKTSKGVACNMNMESCNLCLEAYAGHQPQLLVCMHNYCAYCLWALTKVS